MSESSGTPTKKNPSKYEEELDKLESQLKASLSLYQDDGDDESYESSLKKKPRGIVPMGVRTDKGQGLLSNNLAVETMGEIDCVVSNLRLWRQKQERSTIETMERHRQQLLSITEETDRLRTAALTESIDDSHVRMSNGGISHDDSSSEAESTSGEEGEELEELKKPYTYNLNPSSLFTQPALVQVGQVRESVPSGSYAVDSRIQVVEKGGTTLPVPPNRLPSASKTKEPLVNRRRQEAEQQAARALKNGREIFEELAAELKALESSSKPLGPPKAPNHFLSVSKELSSASFIPSNTSGLCGETKALDQETYASSNGPYAASNDVLSEEKGSRFENCFRKQKQGSECASPICKHTITKDDDEFDTILDGRVPEKTDAEVDSTLKWLSDLDSVFSKMDVLQSGYQVSPGDLQANIGTSAGPSGRFFNTGMSQSCNLSPLFHHPSLATLRYNSSDGLRANGDNNNNADKSSLGGSSSKIICYSNNDSHSNNNLNDPLLSRSRAKMPKLGSLGSRSAVGSDGSWPNSRSKSLGDIDDKGEDDVTQKTISIGKGNRIKILMGLKEGRG
mmetsp:Transcript_19770/g.35643  ORF Transcript_19770/g.35643 Transcript_19770/m.35643 type:complete len:564 (-) Transcript_19770:367-2058(-)|eukprot:CAMPEP_0175040538 /NCGR_PEP_ID=MMETSP0052_2-20121109/1327_1 /TAXON_ID=51329 ORGANISM="Polytomella parva, Strain SAG 63-3" /NCGR_SAMPLE_ID=MMETSP0052_2 /ASSEMBLY_ACC=CAM_ASM_000194 /LENGTH=563 /DNA_ID=CAMNT_0016302777 /DNA_START=279 /DNA_END=1970 /DNA_ORIENTATION=-